MKDFSFKFLTLNSAVFQKIAGANNVHPTEKLLVIRKSNEYTVVFCLVFVVFLLVFVVFCLVFCCFFVGVCWFSVGVCFCWFFVVFLFVLVCGVW